MSETKMELLNFYPSMQKKLRKIKMIFDFESQMLAIFETRPITYTNSQNSNFLSVCWFLGKKFLILYSYLITLHQGKPHLTLAKSNKSKDHTMYCFRYEQNWEILWRYKERLSESRVVFCVNGKEKKNTNISSGHNSKDHTLGQFFCNSLHYCLDPCHVWLYESKHRILFMKKSHVMIYVYAKHNITCRG